MSPLTYPNLKADKTKENASCNVLQTYEYKLKGLYTKSATLLNILDTLHSKICDMFSIVCVMMPHVGKSFLKKRRWDSQ